MFPTNPLSDTKIDTILKDLKLTLNDRRISFNEAFKMFDTNEDGFLTIDEFSKGLDKIMMLSNPAKEGLFAYLDK